MVNCIVRCLEWVRALLAPSTVPRGGSVSCPADVAPVPPSSAPRCSHCGNTPHIGVPATVTWVTAHGINMATCRAGSPEAGR